MNPVIIPEMVPFVLSCLEGNFRAAAVDFLLARVKQIPFSRHIITFSSRRARGLARRPKFSHYYSRFLEENLQTVCKECMVPPSFLQKARKLYRPYPNESHPAYEREAFAVPERTKRRSPKKRERTGKTFRCALRLRRHVTPRKSAGQRMYLRKFRRVFQ